jgi:hypothetical protein
MKDSVVDSRQLYLKAKLTPAFLQKRGSPATLSMSDVFHFLQDVLPKGQLLSK